ncbi:DEAD/DEAH box helicase [Nitrosomonas sp. sh817]|uniref:DEAD/DEAH box helicase n=1 Tax=Nitrosomonas sp. sh817 TaxID=3070658 RepID=UPI0027DCA623|nr:DEAD/DEAH box helicase family protein [Nitrosomonas sp. sh817]WMJ07623.1 DEAD/DEAH box helicase family protein [Nitrosomonas sp. sh817]
MNKFVNAISGRLSLRDPQRHSLEILARVAEIVPPRKNTDIAAALEVIKSEYPSVTDFEREFPSLCFAIATGVGKTRLMGAFISYLHLAHGINNFFVLAPNLTIYNKLIGDFQPASPKYVFKGVSEFSINPPAIITGDDYQLLAGNMFDQIARCKINIFNISKINSEVRGGKLPKIKRLAEYIGESYFDYLAGLPDLVLLMDESHRYRASAGVRAINELKPVLGLELTATPKVETGRGAVDFKNIIFDYALGKALDDGFIKEPAVVTRKDFNPAGMTSDDIELLKLEDGIRLHERTKVELETYARETENCIVKPFLLVIARDTTHAGQLLDLIKSDAFFDGRYKDKVIQVDSSQTGEKEDEMIQRLLAVESTEEPTEIVIHVNMLKEGWDVTNLYTIVPLRAANARILIEQSIGRGLRLPYGKRTGVDAVDRLSIVAHDKFQEIIDEANRPDSAIHLKQVVLSDSDLKQKTTTVVSQSNLAQMLGVVPAQASPRTHVAPIAQPPMFFATPEEQKIALITHKAIQRMARDATLLPSVSYLQNEDIRKQVLREVQAEYRPQQLEIEGIVEKPDIAAIVAKTTSLVIQQTIDIPRISVVPKGEVKSGFKPFQLKLDSLRFQPPEETLWVQYLRTGKSMELGVGEGGIEEDRLENHVVAGLIDYDDVSYDDNADLLYDLAGQVVQHMRFYLPEEQIGKVLHFHQCEISRFVHAQMLEHYWEETSGYDVVVSSGFSPLKESAYSTLSGQEPLNFRVSPTDKTNMAKYLFGGFSNCLYPVQKFDSDAERQLAIILDREADKWFKPARGQFQIYYRTGTGEQEYQPDFVAETTDCIYMLEPKARNQLEAPDVIAKKDAAVRWCQNASDHAKTYGGKPWVYLLIPHDVIAENITLDGLRGNFKY